MTLSQLRSNTRRLSTIFVIVDAGGNEIFNNTLGVYINWIKRSWYDRSQISCITPEDDNMLIIYLED